MDAKIECVCVCACKCVRVCVCSRWFYSLSLCCLRKLAALRAKE